VTLYKVGHNLNRCYRTCYTAGVDEVELIDCRGQIEGRLFSAAESVRVSRPKSVEADGALLLEVDGDVPLDLIDWSGVRRIVIGGESTTLPRKWRGYGRAKIPSVNPLCYTAEAALAIALYARKTNRPLSSPANLRYAGQDLYASALPRAKDLAWMVANLNIKSVIDLTQRPRPTIERACRDFGLHYMKSPTTYDADFVDSSFALDLPKPILVHCFHGRDRTGLFVEDWRLRC
jgi:hypothetical protein